MKITKFTILIFLLLNSGLLNAQKIYSTDYNYQSDIKVFVVKHSYQADLLVFRVDAAYKANDNNGLWYFVEQKYKAHKKIYFTDYDYQADLKIYFVKQKYQAGWKNDEKKHLLY